MIRIVVALLTCLGLINVSGWVQVGRVASAHAADNEPLIRTVRTGSATTTAVDPTSGHVFVAEIDDGTVGMLTGDATAETALNMVGRKPFALAIDGRVETVLVANYDDGSVTLLLPRSGSRGRP